MSTSQSPDGVALERQPLSKPTARSANVSAEDMLVTALPGVGARIAERLARVGISTVRDLLFHLPLRYEDRARVVPIAELRVGDQALIEGDVSGAEVGYGRRRSLRVWLSDRSGKGIMLRFFHFSPQQAATLGPGTVLRCYGEVRQGPQSLEMVHPEYRFASESSGPSAVSNALTPVYPSTEGLQQNTLNALTEHALARLAGPDFLPELLPAELLSEQGLPTLADALRYIHRPPTDAPLDALAERQAPAFRRIAFEELLAHQITLRRLRRASRDARAPVLDGDGSLSGRLVAALPFDLTPAQRRVHGEIAFDLRRPHPMSRLLQGDVGSGKTVVAALAALQAIEAGYQVALMAPTELLSEQHRRSLAGWLDPLGLAPLWLAGRHKGRERGALVERIASGEARLVVGTHTLFQEEVAFDALGLVIVDEQHRFGVHQRMRLRDKGARAGLRPHQLIMTATPIPRSLAMTYYADLDLSVIDQLPPGRVPIKTVAVPDDRRGEVIERVRDACVGGRQAYWVCTLIDESEVLECQAAENTAQTLAEALPELRVGLAHGRMKASEREAVMGRFAAGELDLLVATTVIEVGVDVPNASLMIIENPERLGLAQLHQLRGRVGRGTLASHCVLLYHAPLSRQARDRLAILRETTDGFEIARRDLQMRGAGEVLGTRQAGEVRFRVADPTKDDKLLADARMAAEFMLDHFPHRVEALIERWFDARTDYGAV